METRLKSIASSENSASTWQSHLVELRTRLIWSVSVLLVFTLAAFMWADRLIAFLQLLAPPHTIFIQVAPGEAFFAAMRLAIFAGVGLSIPVMVYHVIRFIAPGLRPQERGYLVPFMMLTVAFFILGVMAGYWAVMPLMLSFLFDYGQALAQNQLSIASYLNFCTGFLFATGLVFELPMVLVFASILGLLNYDKLLARWRAAIVASFILGAVVTPSTDPFSQIIMSLLLVGLYGVSLILVKIFQRTPKKKKMVNS